MKTLLFTNPTLNISENLAIVGSSSILSRGNYTKDINTHDEVVRFNRAPVEHYEEWVGYKTTIRIVNPHVFANKPYNGDTDTANFVKEQKDTRFLVIGPENQHLKFENHKNKIDKSCKAYKMDISKAYVGVNWGQPTVGFCFIKIVVEMGIVPDIYGFYGEPGGVGDKGLTHYWEDRPNSSVCHSYSIERAFLTKWHQDGLVNWII